MRPSPFTTFLLFVAGGAAAQSTDVPNQPPVVGRWNVTVAAPRGAYPVWLELEQSGFRSLVGRFVGRIGSARPIGRVEWSAADSIVRFSIPPQWDRSTADLRFEGRLRGDSLVGTLVTPDGGGAPFVGRRAPSLRRALPTAWTEPIPLFNGKDLSNWTPTGFGQNYWAVRDGILVNTVNEGANLRTLEKFQDFKLHVEFRYPRRGDSGIFLRGRYEVQIHDEAASDWTSALTNGAIYNFLIPNQNASLGPDRWQTFDITLVGRRVTVVHNGKTVIADQIIPGPSGSALDADESAPGPIMLQGEETTIEFRNLTISVRRNEASRNPASTTPAASSCASGDSAAIAAVRQRLAAWVRQANAGDRDGMREVWAPGLVGWFSQAALFSDSAAAAAAGLASPRGAQNARTSFELVVDDITASGSVVVVHDLWTETREFASTKIAHRLIRGSELWRCQPDGRWRIARYVSAPEPWTSGKQRGR